jgi:tripartite-type tricarboxylate transporter receptor subunit TctC
MIRAVALLLALAVLPAAAFAQKLEGPLKVVVGYAPGGASDRAARLVADALKDRLGTTVIVENKTGAGGRLAAQQVKATPPGENVVIMGNPAINVVAPLVARNVGYDPQKDFVPVAQVAAYEFAVVVAPSTPVKDVAQLIAWMKANPDKANFGVPATGSLPHFFSLMLGDAAKVQAQVVGYRGSAPLATDLIGGQVPVAIDTVDAVAAQHQAGRMRVIATSGARRSAEMPDVPTLKESGIDLVADGFSTFFAPATMPPERVRVVAQAIHDVMKTPEMQAKFRAGKMEPVAASQEETARALAAYRAKWEPVIRASGFQE